MKEIIDVLQEHCIKVHNYDLIPNVIHSTDFEKVAQEILEVFAKYIRDEEDKFISEEHPNTPYWTGILSGMEQLLYGLTNEEE